MLVAHASRLKVKSQVSLFARMLFRMLYPVVTDVSAKNQEVGFCVFFLVFSLSVPLSLQINPGAR